MISCDDLVVSFNPSGTLKRRGFTASIFPTRDITNCIVVSASVMAIFLFAALSIFVKIANITVDKDPNIVKDPCLRHFLL